MKIERRGKYPGVKLHLDGDECKALAHTTDSGFLNRPEFSHISGEMMREIRKAVAKAIKEDPTLLDERTEEEIKATLMKEYVESEKKLKHIKDGLDWKKIKVEVQK